MGYFENFYKNVSRLENKRRKKEKHLRTRSYNDVDMDHLVKIILTWIVGGVVSLMPTFTYILIGADEHSTVEDILAEFFSEKDIFLVITTLTISTLFELFFSNRKSVPKYIVMSISIILIVLSVHLFSIIQYKHYNSMFYAGATLFAFCIISSVFGYVISSKIDRRDVL